MTTTEAVIDLAESACATAQRPAKVYPLMNWKTDRYECDGVSTIVLPFEILAIAM